MKSTCPQSLFQNPWTHLRFEIMNVKRIFKGQNVAPHTDLAAPRSNTTNTPTLPQSNVQTVPSSPILYHKQPQQLRSGFAAK